MRANALLLVLLVLGRPMMAAESTSLATASGQVVSVNPTAKSLVVKVEERGKSEDRTFAVDDDSKIVKGSSTIALAELAAGEQVTLTYRTRDGRNVVINIGVESKR